MKLSPSIMQNKNFLQLTKRHAPRKNKTKQKQKKARDNDSEGERDLPLWMVSIDAIVRHDTNWVHRAEGGERTSWDVA
jgi:hypothetical protein